MGTISQAEKPEGKIQECSSFQKALTSFGLHFPLTSKIMILPSCNTDHMSQKFAPTNLDENHLN